MRIADRACDDKPYEIPEAIEDARFQIISVKTHLQIMDIL